MPTPDPWNRALDAYLADIDSFADWLSGHCMRLPKVDLGNIERLRRHIIFRQSLQPYPINNLGYLMMTGTGFEAADCREELRARYGAEHAEQVAALMQAAAEAAAENARNTLREMDEDERRAP